MDSSTLSFYRYLEIVLGNTWIIIPTSEYSWRQFRRVWNQFSRSPRHFYTFHVYISRTFSPSFAIEKASYFRPHLTSRTPSVVYLSYFIFTKIIILFLAMYISRMSMRAFIETPSLDSLSTQAKKRLSSIRTNIEALWTASSTHSSLAGLVLPPYSVTHRFRVRSSK